MATTPVVPTPPTTLPTTPDPQTSSAVFDAAALAFTAAQNPWAASLTNLANQTYTNAMSALESAVTSTAKAAEAESSATDSADSAALSQNWATSLTVVGGGLYGARYYAQQAQAAVSTLPPGTIDDLILSNVHTWSSVKITTNRQATLVSGSNIKTVNGLSLLGAGNLDVSDAQTGDVRVTYATSMPAGWLRSGKVYLSASYTTLAALLGSRANNFSKNSDDTGPSAVSYDFGPIASSANYVFVGSGSTGFSYRTTSASAAWTWVSTPTTYVYDAVKSPAETDRFAVSLYNNGGSNYVLGYTNTAAGAPTGVVTFDHSAGGTYRWWLCASNTVILAQSYGYASNYRTYLRSTDATVGYTAYTNGTTDMFTTDWPSMCTDGTHIYVWKYGTGDVYKTTDGISWTTLTNCGVTYGRMYCVHGRLVAVSSNSDRVVSVSKDAGVTWQTSLLPSGYTQWSSRESVFALANPGCVLRLRDSSNNTKLFLTYDFETYTPLTEFATDTNSFRTGIYLPSVQRFVAPQFNSSLSAAALNWSPYSYTVGTQFFTPSIENGWIKA